MFSGSMIADSTGFPKKYPGLCIRNCSMGLSLAINIAKAKSSPLPALPACCHVEEIEPG